jgi:hypothetical protein
MKAAVIRKLSRSHDSATLAACAAALMDGGAPPVEVEGEDEGERLTHVMLAQRVRAAVDAGADAGDAFREVMASVREVLTDG